MNQTEIHIIEQVKLKNPIFIQGLPGLGFVGKLSAEHLINKLQAKKFAELYSPDFPPQVAIQADGTTQMRKNDFYYYKSKKNDLIILTGDDVGLTVQSQYAMCGSIIDFVDELGVKMIYTLGGYGLQKIVREPKVYGAVNDKKLIKEIEKHNVEFKKATGAIVGPAGLIIGLAQLKGLKAVCLMGETHGNYIDPRSAKAVLKSLCGILGIEVELKDLDKKAGEVEEMVQRLEKIQQSQQQAQAPEYPKMDDSHLSYIR